MFQYSSTFGRFLVTKYYIQISNAINMHHLKTGSRAPSRAVLSKSYLILPHGCLCSFSLFLGSSSSFFLLITSLDLLLFYSLIVRLLLLRLLGSSDSQCPSDHSFCNSICFLRPRPLCSCICRTVCAESIRAYESLSGKRCGRRDWGRWRS